MVMVMEKITTTKIVIIIYDCCRLFLASWRRSIYIIGRLGDLRQCWSSVAMLHKRRDNFKQIHSCICTRRPRARCWATNNELRRGAREEARDLTCCSVYIFVVIGPVIVIVVVVVTILFVKLNKKWPLMPSICFLVFVVTAMRHTFTWTHTYNGTTNLANGHSFSASNHTLHLAKLKGSGRFK